MLSAFESALLDRHLRGCAACRSFADDAGAQTNLLRGAPLEQPTRRIELPAATPARSVPRNAAGILSACLVAAAAAAVLVWPGARSNTPQFGAARAGAPVLVVYPAEPSTNTSVEVPRLRMQPASIADGPVHGYFSAPV